MFTKKKDKEEEFFELSSRRQDFDEKYAVYMRKFIRGCLNDLAKRGYSPETAVECITEAAAPPMFGQLTWSCAEACTFLHFKRQYREYSLGFSRNF